MKNDRFYFHESTITNFVQQNHMVIINLEDVEDDVGKKYNLSISCIDVFEIKIDDKISESISMEADDCEVMTLKMSENSLFVIVEWNDYKSEGINVKSYKISCKNIQINVSEE